MKIINNWKVEQEIFTYPINIININNTPTPSPLSFYRTCCCSLAGTMSCYYCNNPSNNIKYTTSTEYKGD